MNIEDNKTDMQEEEFSLKRSAIFNIPNRITLSRLFLAIVFFVFLTYRYFNVAFVIFLVAAVTDWLDGYLARKWELSTDLGRLVDPFVDKVIICGTFIIFVHLAKEIIVPWMVITIVAREFLVSSIRGFSESKGIKFASNIWGKTKMFIQSWTICAIILYYAHFENVTWAEYMVSAFIWITVIVTIGSGMTYVYSAKKTLLAA
ncbi:MAG: CDP-diacylglycerol--glycerol-3-phosphate 3-phosphatidyltransferase [Candidatus Scalindua sp.]|jgi:CDP-diacylglycerol--glycerol-3-phosphate 3-phosphatidyltransferase|nr:CDP-diacylglycerol--glycerol-3-phosphate 3-phosphatidyltransferase [Candidatus Scalindua sp.]MBT5305141.1 CDP-diacylglycerol--glycerol-3-phosphate 3-phosphatidyltransferase [Candidatus Scalindua sp.]MBT6046293.1 CDP-diacylglycerol--glycerol-3-phosphate 3-phosphatidyltransferase [Candidatus Scalindua sp.]MBT6226647.1 CDP-diacylglycerol--glycerol-3-phosphate 3-phosphatidyltransferase [Candidatus Scalindua sp.]MBT6564196.1 CDP-diacylglycerol--glycerol-3-phosphate 3-phosphatidyltransferase [Cand